MRVGVDASMLANPITGIGRYASELLRRLSNSDDEWFLYSNGPVPAAFISRENVHYRCVSGSRFVPKALCAQTVYPMQALADKIDIFWSPTHRLPHMLVGKIPLVVTIHDLVWRYAPETMRPFRKYIDQFFMGSAVSSADVVISVSKNTAADLVRVYPNVEKKIKTIGLGTSISSVDKDSLHFCHLGTGKPYVLFVGTMEPRKNLHRLIQGYALLPSELRSNHPLIIAGARGWGGVDAHSIVKAYGVQDSVHILGFVTEEQLSILYQDALILAMPSLYEGFGLPLVESLSRGIPVLTSNCSSMPEVAGRAGLFVDPQNVHSIYEGLKHLLLDDVLRADLAKHARTSASRYSWDRAAEQTLQTLHEAVELYRNNHLRS